MARLLVVRLLNLDFHFAGMTDETTGYLLALQGLSFLLFKVFIETFQEICHLVLYRVPVLHVGEYFMDLVYFFIEANLHQFDLNF